MREHFARQQSQINALRQEAAVLRTCLDSLGVLSLDRFLISLHRQRFATIRRAHPVSDEASFSNAFAAQELALNIARNTGPHAMLALRVSSKAIGQSSADVLPALRDVFSSSIYVCGGYDGAEDTSTAERFDPTVGAWVPLAPMRRPRSMFSAATLAGRFYVCGGRNSEQVHSSAECFDPALGEWEQLPPMGEQRASAMAAVVGDRLYICGGYNSKENVATCESFDPGGDAWRPVGPMLAARSGAAAAVLGGALFICGGSTMLSSECAGSTLSSVERLQVGAAEWHAMPPMSEERTCPAAVAMHGRLYVCGGFSGQIRHSSVECLDPGEGAGAAWESLRPMAVARVAPVAAVLRGRLYVCGGRDAAFLSSAERYDPDEGTWEPLGPMSARRGAAAATVLGGRLYICGGHDGAEFRRSVERLDPRSGTWELLAPMRSRRASGSAAALWCCRDNPWELAPPTLALGTSAAAVGSAPAAAAAGVFPPGAAPTGPTGVPSPLSMLGTPT